MSSSSSSEELSWISWYCSKDEFNIFCEVPDSYIKDEFNLNGLDKKVSNFRRSLNKILDLEPLYDLSDVTPFEALQIEHDAYLLYGLIHSCYILTPAGIEDMMEKYQEGDFGHCPRVFCETQAVLPIGLSDEVGEEDVRSYCPKCMDVYEPESDKYSNIDGAFFGTTFPTMFFTKHPELTPEPPSNQFVPKLYGFKIHPLAYELQHEVAENPPEAVLTPSSSDSTTLLSELQHEAAENSPATVLTASSSDSRTKRKGKK